MPRALTLSLALRSLARSLVRSFARRRLLGAPQRHPFLRPVRRAGTPGAYYDDDDNDDNDSDSDSDGSG